MVTSRATDATAAATAGSRRAAAVSGVGAACPRDRGAQAAAR
jgi:hypothetical protein